MPDTDRPTTTTPTGFVASDSHDEQARVCADWFNHARSGRSSARGATRTGRSGASLSFLTQKAPRRAFHSELIEYPLDWGDLAERRAELRLRVAGERIERMADVSAAIRDLVGRSEKIDVLAACACAGRDRCRLGASEHVRCFGLER